MRSHTSFILMFMAAALVLSGSTAAHAQLPGYTTYLYEVSNESDYLEGCFDPCMCPMLSDAALTGTFTLQYTGSDGDWKLYDFSAVRWTVAFQDQVLHEVTGSGILRIDFDGGRQQLALSLTMDGNPVESYDSGIVKFTEEFPKIAVTVSMNGMFCYDKVFQIHADRSAIVPAGPHLGWGALKARFDS